MTPCTFAGCTLGNEPHLIEWHADETLAGVESILDEAERLVLGGRQDDYGHPRDDFSRTAILWTGVLRDKLLPGQQITAEDIALCMVQVKVSREINKPKRDNRVDAAGYLLCLDRLETGL